MGVARTWSTAAATAPMIASPVERFGFRPGEARRLIRWPALCDYYGHLASVSDRIRLEELGVDSLGQPLLLLTVSSPSNLARLDELREMQGRLADPRRRGAGERDRLVADGRCVCLVTCSIHGTEVGAAQMAPELLYRLAVGEDAETRRVLDEVVVLVVPSLNPGGLEVVAEWYERTLGTPAEGSVPPELYHPIAGHDNNRDWFMQRLPETRLLVGGVHNRWRPQIVFDLHQMQGNGPRYVLPPYVDPYDPNIDPLLQLQTASLGTAMAAALAVEGKRGVATGVIFDAYSPSRAYSPYHGGVRILAEAASPRIATPIRLEADQLGEARGFDPRAVSQNQPSPWAGGEWTLRDVVDYHLIASGALLDHAARYRDRWLDRFARVLERSLERAEPGAFVLPPLDRQRDPGAAADLLGLLRAGDVEIGEATAGFAVDGVDHPAGSYVVPVGQPFGAFAKTLLEVQHYPAPALYPGGPPRPPYDVTAHTLGLQTGVTVAAAGRAFAAPPLRPMAAAPRPAAGVPAVQRDAPLFAIGGEGNGAVRLANRLLAGGVRVSRAEAALDLLGGEGLGGGAFVVEGISGEALDGLAREAGVLAFGLAGGGTGGRWRRLRAPRVGLYRSWRPSAIDGGWTERLLAEFGFAVQTLRDRAVRRGGLRSVVDVVVLPHGSAREILEGNGAGEYPAEFVGGLGEAGAAQLRRFVEEGGTLVALDGACEAAIAALYLPVANVLERVRSEEFSCPGSLLRLIVDSTHPIAWGYERETVAMFVGSPAFDLRPGHGLGHGAEPRIVARYPLTSPLLSGWLTGAELIAGRAALVEAPVGRGRVVLFGFRPQFRTQTWASYRLLFNALYLSTMEP